MDANWRPEQGSDPAAGVDPPPTGGDWRAQLQPDARSRIVNKIMESLKPHLPVSVPEGLNVLQEIAAQFEERTYTKATNQSDYLRRISLKMLCMETKTQRASGNALVIPNQNNSGKAPKQSSAAKSKRKATSDLKEPKAKRRAPNTTSNTTHGNTINMHGVVVVSQSNSNVNVSSSSGVAQGSNAFGTRGKKKHSRFRSLLGFEDDV